MSHNSIYRRSLNPWIKICAGAILANALFFSAACQHNPSRKELEQNRYFSELLKREDQRFIGTDAFFEKNLLTHPDPEIRQWAAIALSRIASLPALPLLYKALQDEDPMVRAAAAFAVGEAADREMCRAQFRTQDPHAAARLLPLLEDVSLVVRMRAIEALGKVGKENEARKIIHRLDQFRYDGQPAERAFIVSAITALARLNHPGAVAVLEKFARSSDAEFQWRSLEALTRLHSMQSRPLFMDKIASPQFLVRAHAALGIGMLKDPSLSSRLLPLLSPEWNGETNPLYVRSAALAALSGTCNPVILPWIEAAIKAAPVDNAHPGQQSFAIQAAEALGCTGNAGAEPVLLSLLKAPPMVLDAAAIALANIHKDNPARFFALAAAHQLSKKASPLGWVRALAVLNSPEAEKELLQIFIQETEKNNSPDVERLAEILPAIAKIRSMETERIFENLFKSKDAAILHAAFASYAFREGSPAPWELLLDALAQPSSIHDFARLNLFGLLQPWTDQAPVQLALRVGLADDNYDVRQLCAALLRRAGAAGIPQDIPSNRTLSDEMCIMLALNRNNITIAEIETDRGSMEIELFREDAPVTSFQFALLAEGGAYNGASLARTDPEQRIGIRKPAPGKEFHRSIKSEINMRPLKRGSVGIALTGSQSDAAKLFIALQPQSYQDGTYTCFGHVISGMHIADQLVSGDHIRRITVRTVYPYVKQSDPSENTWHPLRGKGKIRM